MYTQVVITDGIFWLLDLQDSDVVLAEVELGTDPERGLRELAEYEVGWDFHGLDVDDLIENAQGMSTTERDMGIRHYWG